MAQTETDWEHRCRAVANRCVQMHPKPQQQEAMQDRDTQKEMEKITKNLETWCSNHLDGLSAKNGKNDDNADVDDGNE